MALPRHLGSVLCPMSKVQAVMLSDIVVVLVISSVAQFYGIDFGVFPSCTASVPGSAILPEGL